MYFLSTIRTSFGPRALLRWPMVRISLTSAELHALIRAIERNSSSAEQEGHQSAAEHLARRATALREAAR